MPALFIYLIKVNVALLIFCAGYYAVLRHLTFYNLNRVYLVTAIIFSTLYPWVNVSDYINRHNEIAKPIQVVVVNWQKPVETIAKTFAGHDQWYWLQAAFWLGVIVFSARLLTQLFSLYRLHRLSEPVQLHQYMIRVIKGNINPFSFWRNIYINPDNHPANELDAILAHEQIHVNEWHTLDILLGEISAIFYWFNPGIWLMKRAIRENIEFITDQKILQKGVDSKAYQYSLLNVNFGAQGNTIVNHFNISTIKKRIMMMNAKRSSNVNITRYLFLIPAVIVLLLIFSVSKAELKKAVDNSAAHIIKTIKTEITRINFIDPKSANSREKTEFLSAVSLFSIATDTVKPVGKPTNVFNIVTDTFTRVIKNGSGKIVTDTFYRTKSVNGTTTNYAVILPKSRTQSRYTIVADTDIKPAMRLVLRGNINNENSKADIYVDGVKISGVDFKNIDASNISSINVIKNSQTSPNGAIYVTTLGHEVVVYPGNTKDTVINIKGKNGEDRTVFVRAGRPDRVRATGPKPPDVVGDVTTSHPALAVVTVTGRKTTQGVRLSDSVVHTYISGQPITKVKINGKSYASTSKKVVVNGDTVYTNTYTTGSKTPSVDSLLDRLTGLTVNSNGVTAKTVSRYRPDPTKIINVAAYGGRVNSISFANKLIIIDGKEATEKQMKKLSADKIDSIKNLIGDAETSAYGDKGKNGVVIITTKK